MDMHGPHLAMKSKSTTRQHLKTLEHRGDAEQWTSNLTATRIPGNLSVLRYTPLLPVSGCLSRGIRQADWVLCDQHLLITHQKDGEADFLAVKMLRK